LEWYTLLFFMFFISLFVGLVISALIRVICSSYFARQLYWYCWVIREKSQRWNSKIFILKIFGLLIMPKELRNFFNCLSHVSKWSKYFFNVPSTLLLKFLGMPMGGNLQNVISKFVRFFVNLGLKILRFSRLKVVFEADIIKR